MMERFATTPFGGAGVRAASFLQRRAIDERRAALDQGGNDTGKADKWQLIRALCEARAAFNLSDRTITVLEALLSFHQEREIDGSQPLVVFPSNAELSLRSRGMADATLRRHIAALVEAGLILRRDSPNGKRYCRRDAQGAIESAFGFDLSPLALAAGEIYQAAEMARQEARECQKLRGEITIHLRDATKIVEAGLSERRAGDWQGFMLRLMPLGRRLSRQAGREHLDERLEALVRLRAEIENAYLNALSEQEMSGSAANNERQYQNSSLDPHIEPALEKKLKRDVAPETGNGQGRWQAAEGKRQEIERGESGVEGEGRAPETKSAPVALSYLLAVCPTLADYARNGIADWQDVLVTAGLVRSMLGISADAWAQAREAMGDLAAAIVVAAILERAEAIHAPGGYLRALTARAEAGQFTLRPMLAALERGRAEGRPGDGGQN